MQQHQSLTKVDTHWTRLLYHDFFTEQGDDKEIFVTTDRSNRDAGRTPAHTAVNRLAIFIAIYTAVAFAVHFLFWPAAAASAPDSLPMPESAAAAAAPNPSPGASQWSPDDSIDPAQGDVTPLCKPSKAAESMSLYD